MPTQCSQKTTAIGEFVVVCHSSGKVYLEMIFNYLTSSWWMKYAIAVTVKLIVWVQA